jgi:hypothetical protein
MQPEGLISVFRDACHWTASWARLMQSISYFFKSYFNIILPSITMSPKSYTEMQLHSQSKSDIWSFLEIKAAVPIIRHAVDTAFYQQTFLDKVLYELTISRFYISVTCAIQRIRPTPRLNHTLCNRLFFFYDERLLAPRPSHKLEDSPLSFVRGYLFNVFAATFHSCRPFLNLQLKDAPCCGDRDPLNMER